MLCYRLAGETWIKLYKRESLDFDEINVYYIQTKRSYYFIISIQLLSTQ